jgi:hypothetical protein
LRNLASEIDVYGLRNVLYIIQIFEAKIIKLIMKKLTLVITVFCFSQMGLMAQQTQSPQNMMEQMQKQMQKMMGSFGSFGGDSTMNFDFKMDTTLNKSFGMLFDGKQWQSLTESGDSTHTDFFQQFLNRFKGMNPEGTSPDDSNQGFNMFDMLKNFEQIMPNMAPQDGMPRIAPENKKKKGEADTKEKKYSTEKI